MGTAPDTEIAARLKRPIKSVQTGVRSWGDHPSGRTLRALV